jgi:hypothetical protein
MQIIWYHNTFKNFFNTIIEITDVCELKGLQTYTNKDLDFGFKYPISWNIIKKVILQDILILNSKILYR